MAAPALSSAKEVHLFKPNQCLPPLKTSLSIRLIDLEIGEHDSDISMSIDSYDLSSPPQYVALSYTWGDPFLHPYKAEKPSRPVRIDTKPFLVTPNLYDALNHWRGWKLEVGTEKTLLWVDAICINQDDMIERNHQVGLMAQIYSRATLVITWVGPPDEDARAVLGLISKLKPIVVHWRSEGHKLLYPHNSNYLFEKTGVSMVTPQEWEALISFYERQYFSRAWIVQEIALAKGAILMLGHHFIHWNDLMDLSVMMVNFRWIPILEKYRRPSMDAEKPRLTLGAPALYSRVRQLFKEYSPSERGQLQKSRTYSDTRMSYILLEHLLYESRFFRATDPRDKIFAFLSIVSHVSGAMDSTTDLLRPDYRLPARKVFLDVTREIATKTDSVSVLSLIDLNSKLISDLPTWVPDYSASKIQALAFICGARLYRAFDQGRQSPELKIVDDVFSLCAIRWDAIADIEPPACPFTLQGEMDLCLQLPEIYFNGQTRVEALSRTLIADTDAEQSPAPETLGNSFRQYVLLAVATRVREILNSWDGKTHEVHDFVSLLKLNNDQHDKGLDAWLPRMEELESFVNSLQRTQQNPEGNERTLEELRQGAQLYVAALESVRYSRVLFTTVGNLLGLAPLSARKGDSIWFFPSSRVPFVLRHCGGARYELIGEAYLHGYMHGELEKYSMPLQYISLV